MHHGCVGGCVQPSHHILQGFTINSYLLAVGDGERQAEGREREGTWKEDRTSQTGGSKECHMTYWWCGEWLNATSNMKSFILIYILTIFPLTQWGKQNLSNNCHSLTKLWHSKNYSVDLKSRVGRPRRHPYPCHHHRELMSPIDHRLNYPSIDPKPPIWVSWRQPIRFKTHRKKCRIQTAYTWTCRIVKAVTAQWIRWTICTASPPPQPPPRAAQQPRSQSYSSSCIAIRCMHSIQNSKSPKSSFMSSRPLVDFKDSCDSIRKVQTSYIDLKAPTKEDELYQ